MFITTTTLKELDLDHADGLVQAGGAYIDLRKVDDYLDVHVPGSICLQYEWGPGLPSRARDCIGLDVGLVLLGDDTCDPVEVAAGLRGKGFTVNGYVAGGVSTWGNRHGSPASTERSEGSKPPEGSLLSVGDPGSPLPAEATFIPLETLGGRVEELPGSERIVIIAARGVRAAMAIGMLERSGRNDLVFWRYLRKS